MNRLIVLILLLASSLSVLLSAQTKKADEKPKIAFFPLAGDAKEALRQRAWDALRLKLDRTGVYDVLDAPRMSDLVAEADQAIDFKTEPKVVRELGALADAKVLVWGEMTNTDKGAALRLNVLDLRDSDPRPRTLEKLIAEATDLRFASEKILETLPGVKPFEHPSEVAVQNDEESKKLWERNPNLVKNGTFDASSHWETLFRSERYVPPLGEALPGEDKINIFTLKEPKALEPNRVLAMRLSRDGAETNGMACLSAPIAIEPDQRYRIQFRYKSDGPTLHVFVKGYTIDKNIKGESAEREVYRRQVPPTGPTRGQWQTVVDDLNPQHKVFPVVHLRIDLYAYLSPGTVMFDDVVLKAVGKQTRDAKDDAIKAPTTRPK